MYIILMVDVCRPMTMTCVFLAFNDLLESEGERGEGDRGRGERERGEERGRERERDLSAFIAM